jgi:hypothetical protein
MLDSRSLNTMSHVNERRFDAGYLEPKSFVHARAGLGAVRRSGVLDGPLSILDHVHESLIEKEALGIESAELPFDDALGRT